VLTSLLSSPAHALAAAGDAASLDRPDPKWRLGPVKYILGKDEDAQFRKLKTEEERRIFIEQFWSRRDPTAGTPANEFKETYARRLEIVSERFTPPEGRGWEEDRGKVVMLLGPPDTLEVIENEPAGGGDAGTPAPSRRARFVYNREVLPGKPIPLELKFLEDTAGGFRLLDRFDFTEPRLTGLEPLPVPASPPPAAASAAPPEPAVPPALVEPPPPTPQHLLMEEILAGTTPVSKLPVAARLDFYKTLEGETLAMLTLAVPSRAGTAPVIAARVLGPDEKVAVSLEREDSFTGAEENSRAAEGADLHYQAGRDLPPGKYSVVAAAKDPSTGEIGFVLDTAEVPDFHEQTLQLSSITLAKKVERLTSAPTDAAARFVLGNFKVLPAPRPVFRAGEDIWLYFQIYNTASDPGTGQPKVKIAYRFEKVERTGNRLLGGRPVEQSSDKNVQIYSVTVQPAWPAGDYRVVVKVDDVIAGATASATIPFAVAK